ncbi:hypothetical protein ACLOJK_012283 [Asimina triloba]
MQSNCIGNPVQSPHPTIHSSGSHLRRRMEHELPSRPTVPIPPILILLKKIAGAPITPDCSHPAHSHPPHRIPQCHFHRPNLQTPPPDSPKTCHPDPPHRIPQCHVHRLNLQTPHRSSPLPHRFAGEKSPLPEPASASSSTSPRLSLVLTPSPSQVLRLSLSRILAASSSPLQLVSSSSAFAWRIN